MIEIDHLTKQFGPITAVNDVSFAVERGEVVGFLGPNGAGKSTTMKMATGFLRPTSGTARICGFDVLEDPIDVKRRVGYLPEGAPMWPDMTTAAFLMFVARVRGFDGADAAARIENAIAKTQLSSVMEQPIDTLSKGYKRRVGLAQALLHDPDVLTLAGVPGIASIETLDAGRLRVLPASGASIIDAVGAGLRDKGVAVDELHVERGRLDDVFRQITAVG